MAQSNRSPERFPYKNVIFFTGAGMSAESGVPTFRGKGGIWKEYDYKSCACQEAFARDADHVWEFHNYRRELVARCQPNEGHRVVARCEQLLDAVTVVTQNIDGLHQAAGSQRVLELHGSLWKVRCDVCGWRDEDHGAPIESLRCPECDAYKRPDIVWFGDSLSTDVLLAVQDALQRCDLLISIGTSAVVYPAAQLPMIAKARGARLIEINPEDTPMSDIYDLNVRKPATVALRELFEALL